MVNIDCLYLTRLLSQKMRLIFLLEAPLGLYDYEFDLESKELVKVTNGEVRKKKI